MDDEIQVDELDEIRRRYSAVYRLDWRDFSYRWHPRNVQSIYYRQAQERALVALLNDQQMHLDTLRVLDIGCGNGGLLRFLLSLGASPGNVTGCDLLPTRLQEARRQHPGLAYVCADAGHLPFRDGHFDLITQYTVLSSLSRQFQERVSREILRVLAFDGRIISYDMRRSAPVRNLFGLEREDLLRLFSDCQLVVLQPLHSPAGVRVLNRGYLLAQLTDRLPFPTRTHYLALLTKT